MEIAYRKEPPVLFQIMLLAMLILTLSGSLLVNGLFTNRTLFPYFTFSIGAGILAVTAVGWAIVKRQQPYFPFTWPVAAAGMLMLYIGLRHFPGLPVKCIYLLAAGTFFITCFSLFSILQKKISLLFAGFATVAILESIICILQALDIVKSNNVFFKVTGTYLNPNVTAMFLAMAFPILFYQSNRKKAALPLLLLGIALVLLKCRTAFVGIAAGCIPMVLLDQRFRSFYPTLSPAKKIGAGLLLIILLTVTGNYLYHLKKDSADGRLFVWKIATGMIDEKPITGVGFGSFERDYNLSQAAYIQENNLQFPVTQHVRFVEMAYNDYLEMWVEGGLPGFLLWIFLLIAIVRAGIKKLKKEPDDRYTRLCFSGVCIFLTMMLVNFSMQAIPVMFMFMVYGAYLSMPAVQHFTRRWVNTGIAALLLIGGIALLYTQISTAEASLLHKKAILLAREKRFPEAIAIEQAIGNRLSNYESYWKYYGNLLMQNKEYAAALSCYQHAMGLSSNPAMLANAASCYLQLGENTNAIELFKKAASIEPNHIIYRDGLLRSYIRSGDTANAIIIARDIVAWKAGKVAAYKEKAKKFLNTVQ